METNNLWQLIGQIAVAMIGAAGVVLAAWIAATTGRSKKSK